MFETRLKCLKITVYRYLTLIKSIEYSVSDDLQQVIEEDFVRERKANPTKVTGQD